MKIVFVVFSALMMCACSSSAPSVPSDAGSPTPAKALTPPEACRKQVEEYCNVFYRCTQSATTAATCRQMAYERVSCSDVKVVDAVNYDACIPALRAITCSELEEAQARDGLRWPQPCKDSLYY